MVSNSQEKYDNSPPVNTKEKTELKEQEHVEVEEDISPELEELLHTDIKKGLTAEEAAVRLEKFGHNELAEHKTNPFLKFLGYFTDPIAILIMIAMIFSGVVEDWISFGIIGFLLLLNAAIGYGMEAKAESALDALKNTLALQTKCWRDGKLDEVNAVDLVPGDIIVLRLGDVVPADCRLLGVGVTGDIVDNPLQIDQSALTGESLPVSKVKGSTAYSSSIVKQGQMMGVVTKTGSNTFIGRAANLISVTNEQGHFQKIVGQIGNFLVIVTIVLVVILFIYLLTIRGTSKQAVLGVIADVVVITVAAVPVGLPTVLSVTMAIGAKQLAAKQVIVKRLTAVEEMASVSVLCSDKTGTLTLNELTFDKPYLCENYTSEDLLLYSYIASEPGANDPIEKAVRFAAEEQVEILKVKQNDHSIAGYKVSSFLPFNPTSKRTQATVFDEKRNESYQVSKGAPPTIINLVGGHNEGVEAVNELASRGLRALGVARTMPGKPDEWHLVGMISLLDPPRHDSEETVKACLRNGVSVKMITGDQQIIAKEVAHRLGMQRTILDARKLVDKDVSEEDITRRCERADGFAQVIPEHKYRVVELLQNKGYLVGMTGDGVNDAPALKKANVGIAVHGCTDAARSAADIVLLAPGLSTIVDGITTSRAIFQRMRSFALYRITSTIHILMFFFLIIFIEKWTMEAVLLILITGLNDLATIVIAFDNAQISQRPDKWRIGQLIFLSTTLAVFLTAASFGHFYVAKNVFDIGLDNKKLQTIMYLHLSSCPHFVIFSTRLGGFFWHNLPSPVFFTAIMATQVFAMLISIFGIPGFIEAIGWGWGLSVIGVSLGYFVILDFVKVVVFKFWSFEFTAKAWPTPKRRTKLANKKRDAIIRKRLIINISKIRAVYSLVEALNAINNQA